MADDNKKNLQEYEEYLKSLDIRVFKMSSGEEIVSFVENETKGKIILDNPMKILQTYYAIDRWPIESEIERMKAEGNDSDEDDPDFDEFASRMEVKMPSGPKDEATESHSVYEELNVHEYQDQQKEYIFSEADRKRIISTEHFVDWTPYASSSYITINSAFVVSEVEPSTFFKHLYLESINDLFDDHDRSIESDKNEAEQQKGEPVEFGSNKINNIPNGIVVH